MTSENITFGKIGENAAANYVLHCGYAIVERNYRTPFGEIDLVLQNSAGFVIFAEVKTRSSTSFGYPEEAVDHRKLNHMIRSANYYIDSKYQDPVPWRIDIIAILFSSNKKKIVDLKWFENVTEDL